MVRDLGMWFYMGRILGECSRIPCCEDVLGYYHVCKYYQIKYGIIDALDSILMAKGVQFIFSFMYTFVTIHPFSNSYAVNLIS
jgi:hypothetical protein